MAPEETTRGPSDRGGWGRWLGALLGRVLVLLLVAELALRLAFAVGRRGPDFRRDYGEDRLRAAYPGWTVDAAVDLLEETYRPLAYESFTGFRERPRRGRYVNVMPEGYRLGRTAVPWPPVEGALNVFFLGGSTTFGYGATDSTTIPALVEERLARSACPRPVHVYNLGQGWYYSSQEQALFERLLRAGIRPTVAVFIDGTNDSERDVDQPYLAAETGHFFEYNQGGIPLAEVARIGVYRSALGRLALGIARRLAPHPPARETDPAALDSLGRGMVARWRRSHEITEAVAKAAGVRTVTVIQPSPYYQMDLATHPFRDWIRAPERRASFFEALDRERAAGTAPSMLWLAGIQQGRDGHALYVDDEHYTPVFSAEIADSLMGPILAALPDCAAAR